MTLLKNGTRPQLQSGSNEGTNITRHVNLGFQILRKILKGKPFGKPVIMLEVPNKQIHQMGLVNHGELKVCQPM